MDKIEYINRETNEIESEQVYGVKAIKWLYESSIGKGFASTLSKRFISKFYGALQNTPRSSIKIGQFVIDYKINIDEYEIGDLANERKLNKDYANFNDFFVRRFKEGARVFNSDNFQLGAFAEARYFGFDSINDQLTYPVKGQYLQAKKMLENDKWDKIFSQGPMLIARLCPTDYHRFHFPCDGNIVDNYRKKGHFHSVNPIALTTKNDILCTNEREITILDTAIGKLAYIEVGAMCVGKIKQTIRCNTGFVFNKGMEKGYFLFGGSTVIIMGEKDKWTPSKDILLNTSNKLETFIKLGDLVTS